jgi:hypothetical protein
MLPAALAWLQTAQECFDDEYGSLTTGLLTSVAMLVVGVERVFHLEEMEDRGFALLSGGYRPPSRHTVGAWRRHIPWQTADAFCRRTSPWEWIRHQEARVSFDEHTVPRWTKKFSIPKGYITTRNKHMRCEKLFYGYDLLSRRYLLMRATPGNVELRDVACPLTRRVLDVGQPKQLRAYFDAGAGKSDANVRTLFELAATNPNLDVSLRAVRYPHRMRQWKATPREEFVRYEEAGPYVGAPPKEIYVAETRTVLKGEDESQAVRTILGRDVVRGPKRDRWNPLYTSGDEPPYQEIQDFRQRQHHEQAYRIGVYDQFLDAVPCGYDKQSPNPKRPRFPRGPLQMLGWLVALVLNAIMDLADQLPTRFHQAHVRTIRRTFFNRPGDIYLTPDAVIVWLDEFGEQQALQPVLDRFNAAEHRVPWLDNRLLVLSLPAPAARAGP